MLPSAAARTAARSACVKAAASVTVWSAGVTTSTGSAPPCCACSAASVSAGAVLRAQGSSSTVASAMPASASWSSVRKRCSSLPTTSGGATSRPGSRSAASRPSACWNRLALPPPSTRNCFG